MQELAQNTSAAAVAASPTTMEAIDAVVKPLVDSAVGAGEKAGSFLLDAGETALGAVAFVLTAGVGHTATEEQDTVHTSTEKKNSPEPAAAAGGSGKGLPPGANKLRGGQGYRDKDGNIWKKDQLHKDHWDVTDRKGNKVKEVTFDGRQLWPNGPKNNQ